MLSSGGEGKVMRVRVDDRFAATRLLRVGGPTLTAGVSSSAPVNPAAAKKVRNGRLGRLSEFQPDRLGMSGMTEPFRQEFDVRAAGGTQEPSTEPVEKSDGTAH